jgi:tetratricopeptide (TPR) repeat protein
MKNRKHSARQRIDTAERYRAKASDLFVWTDSDSPSERRNLETALVNIKRALLLDPDNYEFLVLAGDILCSLDDEASVAAALEYYERAIRLEPENPDAYDSKSSLLMYWTEPPEAAEAERLARKAVALAIMRGDPESLELKYSNLIGVLETRHKFDALRWTIRQALKKCPSEFLKDLTEATLKRVAIVDAEGPKKS